MDTLVPGRLVERVVAGSNPDQAYALYLPSSYDPAKRRPLLLLMDPRGRALQAMERFRAAAEELGWVVMSSYNTRSDVAQDPNTVALTAMIQDANARLAVDPRRVYLAGFSGTARAAWILVQHLGDHAAGILGFGAGFPGLFVLPYLAEMQREVPFAFFGGAGRSDFNYDELHEVDGALDRVPVEHRVVYYPGPHAWPPAEIAAEGLRWLELQAMRGGLRSEDRQWAADSYRRDLERARQLLEEGWLVEAHARLSSAVRDYDGLADVTEARALSSELASSASYRQAADRERVLRDEAEAYRRRFAAYLDELDRRASPPRPEKSLRELRIVALKRRVSEESDPLDRTAAERLLATVLTQTQFYKPAEYLNRREPEKAIAVLELARAIAPGSGWTCLQLARAHAAAGAPEPAARELRCALEKRTISAESVATDPWLSSVKDAAEIRALLEAAGPSP